MGQNIARCRDGDVYGFWLRLGLRSRGWCCFRLGVGRRFSAGIAVFYRAIRNGREVAIDAPSERASEEGKHRSEEHTSELQSRGHLVCRLLLEKKKKQQKPHTTYT